MIDNLIAPATQDDVASRPRQEVQILRFQMIDNNWPWQIRFTVNKFGQ
jgi:hypothetical protein